MRALMFGYTQCFLKSRALKVNDSFTFPAIKISAAVKEKHTHAALKHTTAIHMQCVTPV